MTIKQHFTAASVCSVPLWESEACWQDLNALGRIAKIVLASRQGHFMIQYYLEYTVAS